MKNLKKITRNDLKHIVGGKTPCKHVIQGSDGTWVTRTGYCVESLGGGGFCNTGLGQTKVTSNGGVSRCD